MHATWSGEVKTRVRYSDPGLTRMANDPSSFVSRLSGGVVSQHSPLRPSLSLMAVL